MEPPQRNLEVPAQPSSCHCLLRIAERFGKRTEKSPNAEECVLPTSLFLGFVPLIFFICCCCWLPRTAFGVLAPWPGIESTCLTLEAWSLNHWVTREISVALILVSISSQLPISRFSLLSLPFALHLLLWNLEPIEPAGMFSLKSCSPWTPSTQGKGNYIFFPLLPLTFHARTWALSTVGLTKPVFYGLMKCVKCIEQST